MEASLAKTCFYHVAYLPEIFQSRSREPTLIHSRSLQVSEGRFRDLRIHCEDGKLLISLAIPKEETTEMMFDEAALHQ